MIDLKFIKKVQNM